MPIYSTQSGPNTPARMISPEENARINAQQEQLRRDEARRNQNHRRLLTFGKVAGIGIPTAGLALSAAPAVAGLYSGGGGAVGGVGGTAIVPSGAATSMGGTAAGAGKFATLGKLFNSPGAELGVNAALSIFGQRSQNKAADQARADALAAQRESLALQRQQLEMEATNANLDREDAKALNAAINELKKRELDASEEERAYRRGREETEDRRLQPYRDISGQALQRLQQMWGLQ